MDATNNTDLQRLAGWTARSDIQLSAGADAGAVRAWLNVSTDEPAYLYTEITGYFSSHACNLAVALFDKSYYERARLAVDWICNVAMTPAGVLLTRKYPPGAGRDDRYRFERGLTVFFDNCMAATGILRLGVETSTEHYVDAARRVADATITIFLDAAGNLGNPVYDLAANEPCEPAERWSMHAGSFNVKCAMLFLELDRLFPGAGYDAIVDNLVKNALSLQSSDGRFVTGATSDTTHLHPCAYTIEGLLAVAQRRNSGFLFGHAAAGLDFIFTKLLNPETGLRHAYPDPDDYCGAQLRSDAVAQALRSYHVARWLQPEWGEQWVERVALLHERLAAFALGEGTSYGTAESGELLPFANVWCHFFRTEAELFRAWTAAPKFQEPGGFWIT